MMGSNKDHAFVILKGVGLPVFRQLVPMLRSVYQPPTYTFPGVANSVQL